MSEELIKEFDGWYEEFLARARKSGHLALSRYSMLEAFSAGRKHMETKPVGWQPIETAPKDLPILLHAAYPWAVYGIWNEVNKKWVHANLQCDQFEGAWIDTYFENEYEALIDSRGIPTVTHWMPLPIPPALTSQDGGAND